MREFDKWMGAIVDCHLSNGETIRNGKVVNVNAGNLLVRFGKEAVWCSKSQCEVKRD